MATKRTSRTRREVVQKTAYVVPAVLTLAAAPRLAQAGSQRPRGHDKKTEGRGGHD